MKDVYCMLLVRGKRKEKRENIRMYKYNAENLRGGGGGGRISVCVPEEQRKPVRQRKEILPHRLAANVTLTCVR